MLHTSTQKIVSSAVVVTFLAGSLSGCGAVQTQVSDMETKAMRSVEAEQEKAAQPIPVVTTTTAAWLMGQSVQVLPTPSPMLTQDVSYCPRQRVALSDLAAWITQNTGLVVDTAEVQATASNSPVAGPGATPSPASFPGMSSLPPLPALMGVGSSSGMTSNTQSFSICYKGTLSGLLEIGANTAGVWSKFSEGRIVFYRTETKTFYLPAISRKWAGSSSIATSSGTGGASGGSSSGPSGTTTNSSSGSSNGGATSTSDYLVDVWGELEKTAKTVAGNAQVVASPSAGSLTVTGTPTQVRNVEAWAKNLADNLSQQVSITVHVYKVKVTNEDNYNWNPNVVFNSLSGKYGFNLSGPQTPVVLSGLSPFNLSANVLKNATGKAAEFSGSQLAFQALSTLGHVTETMQQTVVTLNGQPAPIQVANQLTYLAATTPGASAIGTAPVQPTLTPGQITTGFSAMFLPRIVNGKILMAMNMTSSTLVSLGNVTSGGAMIQTPNVDISTFPNSFILTPGDTLLLTGLQLNNGKSNQSGVGSPSNYLLGGGVDHNIEKQIIAIVITAKVL